MNVSEITTEKVLFYVTIHKTFPTIFSYDPTMATGRVLVKIDIGVNNLLKFEENNKNHVKDHFLFLVSKEDITTCILRDQGIYL